MGGLQEFILDRKTKNLLRNDVPKLGLLASTIEAGIHSPEDITKFRQQIDHLVSLLTFDSFQSMPEHPDRDGLIKAVITIAAAFAAAYGLDADKEAERRSQEKMMKSHDVTVYREVADLRAKINYMVGVIKLHPSGRYIRSDDEIGNIDNRISSTARRMLESKIGSKIRASEGGLRIPQSQEVITEVTQELAEDRLNGIEPLVQMRGIMRRLQDNGMIYIEELRDAQLSEELTKFGIYSHDLYVDTQRLWGLVTSNDIEDFDLGENARTNDQKLEAYRKQVLAPVRRTLQNLLHELQLLIGENRGFTAWAELESVITLLHQILQTAETRGGNANLTDLESKAEAEVAKLPEEKPVETAIPEHIKLHMTPNPVEAYADVQRLDTTIHSIFISEEDKGRFMVYIGDPNHDTNLPALEQMFTEFNSSWQDFDKLVVEHWGNVNVKKSAILDEISPLVNYLDAGGDSEHLGTLNFLKSAMARARYRVPRKEIDRIDKLIQLVDRLIVRVAAVREAVAAAPEPEQKDLEKIRSLPRIPEKRKGEKLPSMFNRTNAFLDDLRALTRPGAYTVESMATFNRANYMDLENLLRRIRAYISATNITWEEMAPFVLRAEIIMERLEAQFDTVNPLNLEHGQTSPIPQAHHHDLLDVILELNQVMEDVAARQDRDRVEKEEHVRRRLQEIAEKADPLGQYMGSIINDLVNNSFLTQSPGRPSISLDRAALARISQVVSLVASILDNNEWERVTPEHQADIMEAMRLLAAYNWEQPFLNEDVSEDAIKEDIKANKYKGLPEFESVLSKGAEFTSRELMDSLGRRVRRLYSNIQYLQQRQSVSEAEQTQTLDRTEIFGRAESSEVTEDEIDFGEQNEPVTPPVGTPIGSRPNPFGSFSRDVDKDADDGAPAPVLPPPDDPGDVPGDLPESPEAEDPLAERDAEIRRILEVDSEDELDDQRINDILDVLRTDMIFAQLSGWQGVKNLAVYHDLMKKLYSLVVGLQQRREKDGRIRDLLRLLYGILYKLGDHMTLPSDLNTTDAFVVALPEPHKIDSLAGLNIQILPAQLATLGGDELARYADRFVDLMQRDVDGLERSATVDVATWGRLNNICNILQDELDRRNISDLHLEEVHERILKLSIPSAPPSSPTPTGGTFGIKPNPFRPRPPVPPVEPPPVESQPDDEMSPETDSHNFREYDLNRLRDLRGVPLLVEMTNILEAATVAIRAGYNENHDRADAIRDAVIARRNDGDNELEPESVNEIDRLIDHLRTVYQTALMQYVAIRGSNISTSAPLTDISDLDEPPIESSSEQTGEAFTARDDVSPADSPHFRVDAEATLAHITEVLPNATPEDLENDQQLLVRIINNIGTTANLDDLRMRAQTLAQEINQRRVEADQITPAPAVRYESPAEPNYENYEYEQAVQVLRQPLAVPLPGQTRLEYREALRTLDKLSRDEQAREVWLAQPSALRRKTVRALRTFGENVAEQIRRSKLAPEQTEQLDPAQLEQLSEWAQTAQVLINELEDIQGELFLEQGEHLTDAILQVAREVMVPKFIEVRQKSLVLDGLKLSERQRGLLSAHENRMEVVLVRVLDRIGKYAYFDRKAERRRKSSEKFNELFLENGKLVIQILPQVLDAVALSWAADDPTVGLNSGLSVIVPLILKADATHFPDNKPGYELAEQFVGALYYDLIRKYLDFISAADANGQDSSAERKLSVEDEDVLAALRQGVLIDQAPEVLPNVESLISEVDALAEDDKPAVEALTNLVANLTQVGVSSLDQENRQILIEALQRLYTQIHNVWSGAVAEANSDEEFDALDAAVMGLQKLMQDLHVDTDGVAEFAELNESPAADASAPAPEADVTPTAEVSTNKAEQIKDAARKVPLFLRRTFYVTGADTYLPTNIQQPYLRTAIREMQTYLATRTFDGQTVAAAKIENLDDRTMQRLLEDSAPTLRGIPRDQMLDLDALAGRTYPVYASIVQPLLDLLVKRLSLLENYANQSVELNRLRVAKTIYDAMTKISAAMPQD